MDLSYKLYVCVQTVQSTQGLAKAHESETNTFQTSLKVKTENEIQIKIAKTLMQQDLSKLTKT